MLTASTILRAVALGRQIGGRHVVVVAHPDDEVIGCSGLLCCLRDAVIVQLTDFDEAREAERAAAQTAAGWALPVLHGEATARRTLDVLGRLLALVRSALTGCDAVWTHPYEGGHLDHDSAAWLVQTACEGATGPLRLEFASYHRATEGDVFGDFWADADHPGVPVALDAVRYARKAAALAVYSSQRKILRKFPSWAREVYREAPRYDFTRPAPPPRSRWDVKGYQPSTADWRRAVARMQEAAA